MRRGRVCHSVQRPTAAQVSRWEETSAATAWDTGFQPIGPIPLEPARRPENRPGRRPGAIISNVRRRPLSAIRSAPLMATSRVVSRRRFLGGVVTAGSFADFAAMADADASVLAEIRQGHETDV
jgi:hypothetical protein